MVTNRITYRLKPHALQSVKGREFPQYFIFYDTETRPITTYNTTEHRLKLGVGKAVRRTRKGDFIVQQTCIFRTRDEFYRFISAQYKPRSRCFLIAHNLGFDLQVVGLLPELKKQGFRLIKSYFDTHLLYLTFRKNTFTLVCYDNMNIFKTSLADLGTQLGFEKLHVDFDTVSDEDLLTYCERDVDILLKTWSHWYNFCTKHDLGSFAISIAGQAFNAYRHRFYTHPIYIHNNQKALELERASYFGGRVECFFIGHAPDQPYYKLDINSMYPYVMHKEKYPVKLLSYGRNLSLTTLQELLETFCAVVEVDVETQFAKYPVLREGKLMFPTGSFSLCLSTPELKEALREGAVTHIRRYAIYQSASIFTDYVEYFHGLKETYEWEHNLPMRSLSKLFLNSLYGKFGQHSTLWQAGHYGLAPQDGIFDIYDARVKKWIKIRCILGREEIEIGKVESNNNFPAIASHVTSYARMYLYDIISRAGDHNVYYTDTDSVIVNQKGYDNLRTLIDDHALGKLKCESVSRHLVLRGLKDYEFGDISRIKGIRANAQYLGNGVYVQPHFRSFLGAVRTGILTKQLSTRLVKRLSRTYNKGIVNPDGWITPYVM